MSTRRHQASCVGNAGGEVAIQELNIQELNIYVIENQPTSLLGRDACLQLNLIKLMVDEVAVNKDFPQLFHSLGKLKMQHIINLRDDARTICLYAPCKVPHPLLPRVEGELRRMEQQGVISKVTQPTDWCSGMVVVSKAD